MTMCRPQLQTLVALCLGLLILMTTAAQACVTIVAEYAYAIPSGAANWQLAITPPPGCDKLVYVLSGEHKNVGGVAGFSNVQFGDGGPFMTEVVQEATDVAFGIFYIDSPGTAAVNMRFTSQDHMGGQSVFYWLANTAPGIGATNQGTAASITLDTTWFNSFVIVGVTNGGPNKGFNVQNGLVLAPLTEGVFTCCAGPYGGSWVGSITHVASVNHCLPCLAFAKKHLLTLFFVTYLPYLTT
jgi:hypothetical protein